MLSRANIPYTNSFDVNIWKNPFSSIAGDIVALNGFGGGVSVVRILKISSISYSMSLKSEELLIMFSDFVISILYTGSNILLILSKFELFNSYLNIWENDSTTLP